MGAERLAVASGVGLAGPRGMADPSSRVLVGHALVAGNFTARGFLPQVQQGRLRRGVLLEVLLGRPSERVTQGEYGVDCWDLFCCCAGCGGRWVLGRFTLPPALLPAGLCCTSAGRSSPSVGRPPSGFFPRRGGRGERNDDDDDDDDDDGDDAADDDDDADDDDGWQPEFMSRDMHKYVSSQAVDFIGPSATQSSVSKNL